MTNIESLYSEMLRIRYFEETLLRLYSRGHIRGTVHTCTGQEACAVGVVGALDSDRDVVCSNHRGHGHFLSFGGSMRSLLAEILGYEEGICRGKGGSQHLHIKNFYSNGILGGMTPVATGIAMDLKMARQKGVCVIFLGDGAMAEGIVYEALNIAKLWALPLLLVVEHNKIAQSSNWKLEHSGPIDLKVKGFGIQTTIVDGSDVIKIREISVNIVDEIRSSFEPQCLVLDTFRLGPHSKGDDTRSDLELIEAKEHDPLLKALKGLSTLTKSKIDQECLDEIGRLLTDFKLNQ